MSQLAQTLLNAAEEIRLSSPTESAVEHLKQAGFTEEEARLNVAQHLMEKEATEALTLAGVDIEQAVSMVKAAGVNLKDLVSFEPEIEEEHVSIPLLKQAAHYVEALEAEVQHLKEELEKAAAEKLTQGIELPEPITKAAGVGAFTKEDLLEMQRMNQGTLTKIASVMDEPWSMGTGVGMPRPKGSDPFTEWLVS
jgi:hypothetical protein